MSNPAKGWTPARRKRQSEAIKRWKPWSLSTGPKSPEGKAAVSGNAWTGGEWLKLRQLIKKLNQTMREQRDMLGKSDQVKPMAAKITERKQSGESQDCSESPRKKKHDKPSLPCV